MVGLTPCRRHDTGRYPPVKRGLPQPRLERRPGGWSLVTVYGLLYSVTDGQGR